MKKRDIMHSIRIILAIAAKDALDAIKNRTTLSILLGACLLMISGQALPLLMKLSAKPTVLIYDTGRSRLIPELKKAADLRLGAAASEAELRTRVAEASSPVLGLSIPADFDALAEATEGVKLQGYVPHWIDAQEEADMGAFFEERLSRLIGQPVEITTEGNAVYPSADAGGQPFMSSLTLVLVIVTIAGAVVPYLLIDEKETRTLEALLVTPASIGQVVIGKALAGAFLGLLAAAATFLFSWRLVGQWGMAILASILTTLLAVALGLALGSLFDEPQAMVPWFGAVLALLMLPMLLAQSLSASTSPVVRFLLPRVPTIALSRLFRIGFSNTVSWGTVLADSGLVLACTVVLLVLVGRRLQRSDR